MKMAWILAALSLAPAVPLAGQELRGPLPLSLKRAVELAVSPEGNTNIQLSGEVLKQARERVWRHARPCCRTWKAR